MNKTISKMISLDIRGFQGTTKTLLNLFKHIAKKEGWNAEEIQTVITEATKHDDHEHIVETIRKYCK